MEYIICEMKEEDTKQVQNVAGTSWRSTYAGIIPQTIQENFLKTAYSDEMMEKRLNNSFLFVAKAGEHVVGFADFTPVNEEGQSVLNAIYLYPDWQGKGIGTALLQRGIKELDNANEICVDVEKENATGKTFYEAKGFQAIKEYDDDFDGHILKTVHMCLAL